MATHKIVLLEQDSTQKHSLGPILRSAVSQVEAAGSLAELRQNLATHRAEVAVVDMEMISTEDVMHLSREFPGTCIVCHHRLADEQMWAAVMNAGAADICSSTNPQAIVTAVLQTSGGKTRSAAA